MNKIKFENIFNILFPIIVPIILVYFYNFQVQPKYEYMGYPKVESFSFFKFFISIVFLYLSSMNLVKVIEKPSHILMYITYLFVICPTISLMSIVIDMEVIEYLLNMIVIYFSFLIICLISKSDVNISIYKEIDKRLYIWLFFIFLFFSISCVIYFYGFNISKIFSLSSVGELYDIRNEFRNDNSSVPSVVQYLFFWNIKVLVPFLFLFGLLIKNKKLILISLFLQFVLFSVSGQKSIFLGLIFVYCFWVLLNRYPDKSGFYLKLSFFILLLTSLILILGGQDVLLDIIVRRMIIIPGVLTSLYFDFFSQNDFSKFGYSIFKGLFDYNYDFSPPFVIGSYYFSRSDLSANANFIASAYGEFGYISCIIFSLLVSVIYKVIDSCLLDKNNIRKLCTVGAVLPTWALADSALLTTLITHGLFAFFILIIFIPRFNEH